VRPRVVKLDDMHAFAWPGFLSVVWTLETGCVLLGVRRVNNS